MDRSPENKRKTPSRNRTKGARGDALLENSFNHPENALSVLVDLLFDGRGENDVGGRQKIMDHLEIILVGGAEIQIGGGHTGKLFRGCVRLPAGAQNFAVEDIEPLGLEGRKDILLVFKIEIDGANAQLGGPRDLIDGGQGQALLRQEVAGSI